jgi:tetratricopeptide (TPR) repeat protein
MKETIIIFGNCQAQVMANCLNSISLLSNQYEIIWERNVDLPGWPPKEELPQSKIENCAYLFEQIGRKLIEFPQKDKLPSDCVIVRYPYLKLECLWPLLALNDPRNKVELPKYGAGRFPYGDKLVIGKIKNNVPKEVIFNEYMQMNIKDHVDLDQRYGEDLQRITLVDEMCDVKVFNFIAEQVIDRRLFHTFCHPTSETMKFLLLEILKMAGLIEKNLSVKEIQSNEEGNRSHALAGGVAKYFEQPILAGVQVPIHPQVCEHFNLSWADTETRYQYFDYGALTFKEYMHIYIDYEEPEIEAGNNIRRLLEADNFQEANEALRQALIKYPNSPTILNLKGELMLKTGALEAAKNLFLDIYNRFPDNLAALNNLAVSMIYENNWDGAVDLLLQILGKDPSNATAKENLQFVRNEISLSEAKGLLQKGCISEAKKILETVLCNDDKHTNALNQLAAIHIKEENYADAQKKLSTALAANPTNEETLKNLNTLQKKLMDYDIDITNKASSAESLSKIREVLLTRMTLGPNGPLPFINDEKKFIMFWMPRCGYTTSIYWFFGTLGLHNEIDTLYPELDLLFKVHRYAWEVWPKKYYGDQETHQILETVVEKITNPDYYKFVIVRNPYSRLVSLFRGLMANPELFNILVPDKNEKISFAQFIDSLFNMNLYFCDFHLRYQTANLCWGSGVKLDEIIELEKLSDGLDRLNRIFGLNVPIIKMNASKKFPRSEGLCFADHHFDDLRKLYQSEGLPHYTSFYTPELKEKVYKLFKSDFETLGYTFDEKSAQTVSSTQSML